MRGRLKSQSELLASLALLAIIGILLVGITSYYESPAGGLIRPLSQPLEEPIESLIQKCTQEICDGIDNDCDNIIDEGELCGSGYSCVSGVCQKITTEIPKTIQSCTQEVCDGIDNDCDKSVDEGNLCGFGYACISGVCRLDTLNRLKVTQLQTIDSKVTDNRNNLISSDDGISSVGDSLVPQLNGWIIEFKEHSIIESNKDLFKHLQDIENKLIVARKKNNFKVEISSLENEINQIKQQISLQTSLQRSKIENEHLLAKIEFSRVISSL